ncbi:hypothetical protein PAXRUDRAFT_25868 [Paxillus rubicundulus Ve08.2h10]|uniref:Uncharacterized protein n=1 Tax=Paxillus rubicundulus Ve08.2h10 TaxID=930991 RepID=A0A0D0E828_9AGAM|nr:hypothetical protein PAXRUDRAFT_25868 [Paxillus rubicundulus Ve08.2h10]
MHRVSDGPTDRHHRLQVIMIQDGEFAVICPVFPGALNIGRYVLDVAFANALMGYACYQARGLANMRRACLDTSRVDMGIRPDNPFPTQSTKATHMTNSHQCSPALLVFGTTWRQIDSTIIMERQGAPRRCCSLIKVPTVRIGTPPRTVTYDIHAKTGRYPLAQTKEWVGSNNFRKDGFHGSYMEKNPWTLVPDSAVISSVFLTDHIALQG